MWSRIFTVNKYILPLVKNVSPKLVTSVGLVLGGGAIYTCGERNNFCETVYENDDEYDEENRSVENDESLTTTISSSSCISSSYYRSHTLSSSSIYPDQPYHDFTVEPGNLHYSSSTFIPVMDAEAFDHPGSVLPLSQDLLKSPYTNRYNLPNNNNEHDEHNHHGGSPSTASTTTSGSNGSSSSTALSHSQRLRSMLEANEIFVDKKEFKNHNQDRGNKAHPSRCVVVTCMDTRLTTLLPAALDIRPGDAKIIKNAGAMIAHPFGSSMRSVIVALYMLNADEVFVVGHYDCGMSNVNTPAAIHYMLDRGHIAPETLRILASSGIDLHRWLHGFDSVQESVRSSVDLIRNHPLVPQHVPVHGLIIDPYTGKLDLVVDGSIHAKPSPFVNSTGGNPYGSSSSSNHY